MGEFDKISIEKLDNDNFAIWSTKMECVLVQKGWDSALTDPDVTTDIDKKALALIKLSVANHFLHLLQPCTTTKQAWKCLEDIWKVNAMGRRMMLKQELARLKKDGSEAITEYISRACAIRDQLMSAGLVTTSEDLVMSLLNGLPSEYRGIVSIIENTVPTLPLDSVMSKLIMKRSVFPSLEPVAAAALPRPTKQSTLEATRAPPASTVAREATSRGSAVSWHARTAQTGKWLATTATGSSCVPLP